MTEDEDDEEEDDDGLKCLVSELAMHPPRTAASVVLQQRANPFLARSRAIEKGREVVVSSGECSCSCTAATEVETGK